MAVSLLACRKPLVSNMAGSFLCINELRALYFGKNNGFGIKGFVTK